MTIQIVQGQPAVRVPSEFFPFDSKSGARAGSMVQPSDVFITESTLRSMIQELDEYKTALSLYPEGTLFYAAGTNVFRITKPGSEAMLIASTCHSSQIGRNWNGTFMVFKRVAYEGMKHIYVPGETEKSIAPGTCWRATAKNSKSWSSNTDRLRWNGTTMKAVSPSGCVTNASRSLADAMEAEALGYWERVADAPKGLKVGEDVIFKGTGSARYRTIVQNVTEFPALFTDTYHGHYTVTETMAAPAFPGKGQPGDQGYGLFYAKEFLGYTKDLYPNAPMQPALPWPEDLTTLIGKKVTYRASGGKATGEDVVVVQNATKDTIGLVFHCNRLDLTARVLVKVEDADLSGYNAEVANVAGTLKVTRLVAKKAA